MQQAPVVYGTPTESVQRFSKIERWMGFDSPPVHRPAIEDFSHLFFGFVLVIGISRATRKSWHAKCMWVQANDSKERRARQGKEGAYKNESLRLQLGWGKKDPADADADNERLKGKGKPGRTLARARAAMGYVRAVGARVSFDDAADGDGGGGVELRAGMNSSARKMPESSISCSSFFPPNCVGTNPTPSTSASPLSSLNSTSSSLARARMSGAMGTRRPRPVRRTRGLAAASQLRCTILTAPFANGVRVLVYALGVELRRGGGGDERVRAVGAGVVGGVREGAGGGEGGGRGRGVRGVGRAGALGRVGVGVGRGRQGAGGAGECERGGGRGALVLRREGEWNQVEPKFQIHSLGGA
ncbi:hypothetical protein B0H14DRAFT_2652466 [Mycena olivaceomarginata]|nr:hypothetical protein B0H14DRAFT_2652466 [Mycena olivaceomarginata]